MDHFQRFLTPRKHIKMANIPQSSLPSIKSSAHVKRSLKVVTINQRSSSRKKSGCNKAQNIFRIHNFAFPPGTFFCRYNTISMRCTNKKWQIVGENIRVHNDCTHLSITKSYHQTTKQRAGIFPFQKKIPKKVNSA